MIQTVYKKPNGEIVKRIRHTYSYPIYGVGEITKWGWQVLSIKYKYGKKWYTRYEFDKRVDRDYKRSKKIFKLKTKIGYLYRNLVYFFSLMLLFRIFELSFKSTF